MSKEPTSTEPQPEPEPAVASSSSAESSSAAASSSASPPEPPPPVAYVSGESEYERRRKENIAANARALAALGLDNASLKRARPEQPKQHLELRALRRKVLVLDASRPVGGGGAVWPRRQERLRVRVEGDTSRILRAGRRPRHAFALRIGRVGSARADERVREL